MITEHCRDTVIKRTIKKLVRQRNKAKYAKCLPDREKARSEVTRLEIKLAELGRLNCKK